jgi:hypothetical protein
MPNATTPPQPRPVMKPMLSAAESRPVTIW